MRQVLCAAFGGALLALAAFAGSPSVPLPLEKGLRWTFTGQAAWTVMNSATVKTAAVCWVMEILEVREGSAGRAAVVRGYPDELAEYEPGRVPALRVLFCARDRLFAFPVAATNAALALARRLATGKEKPADGEPVLELPLTVGRTWGGDTDREDKWYCWHVERSQQRTLDVKGLPTNSTYTVFTVAYRTNPDHEVVEFAPGVGIVRFEYVHHGTVAQTDVRLTAIELPPARDGK